MTFPFGPSSRLPASLVLVSVGLAALGVPLPLIALVVMTSLGTPLAPPEPFDSLLVSEAEYLFRKIIRCVLRNLGCLLHQLRTFRLRIRFSIDLKFGD